MLRVLLLAGQDLAFALLGSGRTRPPIGGSERPCTGSFSGSSAHDLATGEFHSIWTGEASHFGISNLEQQAQLTRAGPATFAFSGTWTLTAANGDQLCGTAAGTLDLSDATHGKGLIDCTATGGTGRFAEASGTFTITIHHIRTALEDGISYGQQQATLVGQLSW